MLALPSPLLTLPGISHGFFTRKDGISEGIFASLNCAHGTGDDPGCVNENMRRIGAHLGTEAPLKAWQVHGADTVIATAAWQFEDRPKADAIVTNVPGLSISVTTADCAPVLLADAEAGVVGAAHAGWKGALAGIVESVVASMESLGARRLHIRAAIGPCIRQQSYEVGPEFYERFTAASTAHARFFLPAARAGHWMFDLPSFVAHQLEKSQINHVNMLANDTCFEEDTFFSNRRATLRGEKAYGCQLSAIMVKQKS